MRGLIVALAFLTRLPVAPGEVSEAELAHALKWFPAVGLVLGAGAAGLAALLAPLALPELSAIAIAALLALASGALHLDGLADVFDGLGGGGGDRARMLAIMRDSRIGAHGAVALVLFLLAKVTALRLVLERDLVFALWAAPIAARFAVAPLIAWFPYAREHGLGTAFAGAGSARELLLGFVLTFALLAPFGVPTIAPAIAACASALLFGLLLNRKLAGLTGDVYGAAIELAELSFLLASVVALKFSR